MIDLAKYPFNFVDGSECSRFGTEFIYGNPECEICEFSNTRRWKECRWRQLGEIEPVQAVGKGKGRDMPFIPIDWSPITEDDFRLWMSVFHGRTLFRSAIEHFIANGLISTVSDMNDYFKRLDPRTMTGNFVKRTDFSYTIINYIYEFSKQFRFYYPFTTRRYGQVIGIYKAVYDPTQIKILEEV